MSPRQIGGGVLSAILLFIFLFLLWNANAVALSVVACGQDAACAVGARNLFNQPMQIAFGTIGGLVAAIVVAELAITKPNDPPAMRLFTGSGAAAPSGSGAKIASIAYLVVWVMTGLGAFIWWSLKNPDALKILADYGNGWFGLAIAAAYAYFGIDHNT